MKAVFTKENLNLKSLMYESLFRGMYDGKANENIHKTMKFLNKELKDIVDSFNTDLDELNDNDYVDFVEWYYNIDLNVEDYKTICGETNHKKYNYIEDVKTDMAGPVVVFRGKPQLHGSWYLQDSTLSYNVLLSEDIPYDEDKRYSIAEMRELMQEKDMVLLREVPHPLKEKEENVSYEDVEDFETVVIQRFMDKKNIYFKEYANSLRNVVNRKKVLIDLKEYAKQLQNAINFVMERKQYNEDENNLTSAVSIKLSNSKLYGEYQEVTEELNKRL